MDKSKAKKSGKKTGKPVTRSPRTAITWSIDKRNRAAENDEFLQVAPDGNGKEPKMKSNRKFGGAEKCWTNINTSDYVFEPVSRLCGPEEVVRDVLESNFSAIKKAMSKDKSWSGKVTSVDELMDRAWNAKNHAKNDDYLKEKKRVEENKNNAKEARDSGKPRGKFNIDDIDVILETIKAVNSSASGSTGNDDKKPRMKGGIFAMNAKARKEGYNLDVSKMNHVKGTCIRPLREDDIERLGLKTVEGVDGMIIYSNNAASFNAAMALLSAKWPLYKDYIGKWDDKVEKGAKKITEKQITKEQAAVNAVKKVTKKKNDSDDESDADEAQGSDAESEEDEEKPTKKANGKANGETKVSLKKKAAGDAEETEKVEPEAKKDEGSATKKGPKTLGDKAPEEPDSAIAQAEKKKGSTLRKRGGEVKEA
jgi:hypothetical protein